MTDRDIKQVILIRRDLGMRRGKDIAQGAHASMAFLSNAVRKSLSEIGCSNSPIDLTEVQFAWLNGSFAKVALQVSSEKELLMYYDIARTKGLTAYLITDSGRTEFYGTPTNTAVAIGPDYSDLIDEVTGELKLY